MAAKACLSGKPYRRSLSSEARYLDRFSIPFSPLILLFRYLEGRSNVKFLQGLKSARVLALKGIEVLEEATPNCYLVKLRSTKSCEKARI